MTPNVELAIRVLVFLVMVTVGLDLRWRDFLHMRQKPKLILGVVGGQWVALLLVAGLFSRFVGLSSEVKTGVLLIAAAPAAALSCFYTQLARGDVALATTVTAASTAFCPLITPLAAEVAFHLFLDSHRTFEIGLAPVAWQTLGGLLLPLAIGMFVTHRFGDRAQAWRASMRAMGALSSMCLVAIVVASEFRLITAQLGDFLLGAVTFTLVMLVVGASASAVARSGAVNGRSVPWSFPARNIAVAVLLATNLDDMTGVAAFIAVLFVTQVALLVPLAVWVRAARSGDRVSDGAY
jgi:BASS family bile acid:Na+ symporter